MPPSCKYDKGRMSENPCQQVEWVVSYMCDHCESDGTSDLCDKHYRRVYDNPDIPRLGCSECQGTISFVSERLDHGQTQETIN